MQQSRLISLVESFVNIGSGFFLSLCVWQIVGPLFGYEITIVKNIGITSIFTVVSITRSYLWRRFFNNGLHDTVVKLVTGK